MDWPEWSSYTPIRSISRCTLLSSTMSIFTDENHSLCVMPTQKLGSPRDNSSTKESNTLLGRSVGTALLATSLKGIGSSSTSSSVSSSSSDGSNHSKQQTQLTINGISTDHKPRKTEKNTSETIGCQRQSKGTNFSQQQQISDDVSTHLNSHLLELQKEIKEEEDEIFADINSAINSHTNFQDPNTLLDSSLTNQWWSENDGSSTESQERFNIYCADDEIIYDDEENKIVTEDPNYDPNTYYEDYQQYGLEEGEDQMVSSYVDQQDSTIHSYPISNLPKPCVFFLEGNCRRSDCKYSHDLSNITCKYWIEGFCFKGEQCPFLHSYNMPTEGLDVILDENGSEINQANRHPINPTFTIESEADFPSLPLDTPSGNSSGTDSTNVKDIKDQILRSNPAVVFKMAKKKRKRG